MKRARGFTLLELMVVVAVIAILAGVAMNSYSKQARKARRAEAKGIIADFALREERLRASSATYTTNQSTLLNGGTAPTLSYYTVAIATPTGNCWTGGPAASTGNAFRITATAVNDQTKDTACPTIVFTNLCGRVTKTPVDCWR
jgi:type IV pilus assembly protein PilE